MQLNKSALKSNPDAGCKIYGENSGRNVAVFHKILVTKITKAVEAENSRICPKIQLATNLLFSKNLEVILCQKNQIKKKIHVFPKT